MKYDFLGNTNLNVSKICMGTMTFGEQNTEEEAHEQLTYALDQGINFYDTAELYAIPFSAETQGLTEKYVGTWLQKTGIREEIILASKIVGPQPAVTWIRPNLGYDPTQLRIALEGSLDRLQTDYIDLYQLHWPERKTNFFGRLGYEHQSNDPWIDNFHAILEVMQDFVNEGKIRYFGISNETPWGAMHFIQLAEQYNLPRIMSIQNPYSLLNRTYEIGLAEISIREKAGLLAYSPLGFGLLSGKYHKKIDQPQNRLNQYGERMSRYNSEFSWTATEEYLKIAEKYGLSLTQMALAFVNTRPFLTSNIIGATTMDQLKENIDSINISLTGEIIREINAIHDKIPNPAP